MSEIQDKKLEGKIKRMKNMPQYRNMSEDEIRSILLNKENKKESIKKKYPDLGGAYKTEEEKSKAEKLFHDYLDKYMLETPADLQILRQKVWLEIYNDKIQKVIQEKSSILDKDGNQVDYIPDKLLVTFRENCNLIRELDESLGLNKDKEVNDGYEAFQAWKRKVLVWLKMNPNKTRVCPHCGKMIFLKLKDPQLYDSLKHPLYHDKVLWNEPLFDLVEQGKITKEEAGKVIGTHADYITKCLEKRKKSTDISNPANVSDK